MFFLFLFETGRARLACLKKNTLKATRAHRVAEKMSRLGRNLAHFEKKALKNWKLRRNGAQIMKPAAAQL